MSLFQRVNFLRAMRGDRAALPECCLLARSKPPPRPPPADKTSGAIAGRPSDTKQMSLMGAELRRKRYNTCTRLCVALQVSFHGAAQKKKKKLERKLGQVGLMLFKTSLHGRRLKTFLHRSAFNTCVRACAPSGCCENLRPSEG